jgi:cation diffusion facilitator CzcD-associated flavoprotein CzcO
MDPGTALRLHVEKGLRLAYTPGMFSGRWSVVEMSKQPDFEVIIVGSGFSGLGAGIELKRIGIQDFVILEAADDLGGTWRDNTYPGLTVDVASTSYSYGFEPNPDWSRLYAPGPEVKAYADHCARKYGVAPHIRYRQRVEEARYSAQDNLWTLKLDSGTTYTARYFVSATGLFGPPKLPDIAGVDSFQGKVMHTGAWDHSFDLTGKRVAVVGTGATAIQVIPEIVDKVEHLDVYQRTAIWLLPKPDFMMSERVKRLFRRFPLAQRATRLITHTLNEILFGIGFSHFRQVPWIFRWLEKVGVEHIRKQVHDPVLQDKLTPKYSFFCKRPSFSNIYFPVFNRPDVALVTEGIERITPTGVVAGGVERPVDVLICATGYSVFEKGIVPAFSTYGLNGMEIGDYWNENRFRAFQGITVPGYPNYFMIFGPYSAASASWFGMIDTQVRHMSRCLRAARGQNANFIEVKQQAYDDDFEHVLKRRRNQVMFFGNCAASRSYYFDKHGDVPLIRPATQFGMWLRSHLVSMNNYIFARR